MPMESQMNKVSADEFFAALANESGVTFKCFSTMDMGEAGFLAHDESGNVIGQANQQDDSYVFWLK